jgi:antitoxin CptB
MIWKSMPSDLIRGWVPVLRKDHAQTKRRSREFEAVMTERSSEGLDERRRKLLFRAWRRGVREMDLIVGRFADVYIDKFDEPALDEFERLIEVPNAELYAWVTGDETAPAEQDCTVLRQLIAFHAKTATERTASTQRATAGEGR